MHAAASHGSIIENIDVKVDDYETYMKDILGPSGEQENDSCTSFERSFVDADRSSHVATSTDSSICQDFNVPNDFSSDYYPSFNIYQGMDDRPVVANTFDCLFNGVYPHVWENEKMTSKYASCFPGNVLFEDSASVQHSTCASYISSEGQSLNVKTDRDGLIMPYHNSAHSDDAEFTIGQEMKQLPGTFPAVGSQGNDLFKCEDSVTFTTTEKAKYYQDAIAGAANYFPGHMGNLNLKPFDKSLYNVQTSIASRKLYNCVMSEGEGKSIDYRSIDSQLSKGSIDRSNIEEESDVCIIEDISHPAPLSRSAELANSINTLQSSRGGYTLSSMVGVMRPKARDEQYILRVALQVDTLSSVALGSLKGIFCMCSHAHKLTPFLSCMISYHIISYHATL